MSENDDKAKTLVGMPHALMAEKRTISMLLNDPSLLDEAGSPTEEQFHLPSTRLMLEVIREDIAKGRSLDIVLMTERLHLANKLDAIGGPGELASFYTYECSPTPEKFRNTVAMLREMAGRRMAIRTSWEIERVAREDEVSDLLATTSEPITRLHELLTDTKPARDTKALLEEWISDFTARCKGEVSAMGVETSLEEINRRFLGLLPKRTVVISAYPGGGKSAMISQLAMDAALAGHHTLVCSLEMPEKDMMTRNIAYVSRLPGELLMDPRGYALEHYGSELLPKHVMLAINKAKDRILSSPYEMANLTSANIHQVIACIRRMHRRKPLRVVGVDYIQRIQALPEMRRDSQEQKYAHTSHLLADLCKELDITLLIGSQLNKDGAAKYAEAINEDADLHLQIVQDRNGNKSTYRHLGIAVMKDRHHGNDGAFLPIVLDRETVSFKPMEPMEKPSRAA